MKKKSTGERLETFIYGRNSIEHIHRYALVMPYIENKIVLDIASGEGYGSNLMSTKAAMVYGVDIDAQTVAAAQVKYKKDNLRYQVGSATAIPLDDHSVDVVVSYETIEHHGQHQEMIDEIKRVLKPEGLLIISTPDKLYYSDKRSFSNEFHVKELYKQEFVDLISPKFKNIQLLTQIYCNGNSIIQPENDPQPLQFFTGDYSWVAPQEIDPLYLLIIASDVHFAPHNRSVFNGEIFTELTWKSLWESSNTHKVGSLVLKPFKFLKSLVK